MIVEVTKEKVIITQGAVINSDEIGVNSCKFTLPDCFDGLCVTAVFNGIPVPLVDGKGFVPPLEKGNVLLGVYAYKEVDGKIELMYSPKPAVFYVSQGSYTKEINESAVLEISQYEHYCRMVLEGFQNTIKTLVVNEFDPEAEPSAEQVYSAKVVATMVQYLLDVFKSMVSDAERTINKVAEINENSTEDEYPNAKAVYDFGNRWYQAVKGDLDELSLLIGEEITLPGLDGGTKPPVGGDEMPPEAID